MSKGGRIVIIGAGVFGLSTASQLASEGYQNILVIDRHVPPVPDGSSVDISRIIRFDYADPIYLKIAYEAYQKWFSQAKYKGIFEPSPFVLCTNKHGGPSYMAKATEALTALGLPWTEMFDPESVKKDFPTLSGKLEGPGFYSYVNRQAGWADASKAISQLYDECIELGVSFLCGRAGTAIGFELDSQNAIKAVRTLTGNLVEGDQFILAGGAWSSSLVSMYNSTISTGQVLAYLPLTESEMEKYKDLPIFFNFNGGWFNFPPHPDTKLLKMAVHGWGYTRKPSEEESAILEFQGSVPPLIPPVERANFVPADGEKRLRDGLRDILPELADRPFSKVALCWYTDTPTGDFIMDYHPDYRNLLVVGGGSGHAFKFLPVLGRYTTQAWKRELPNDLAMKWRFRTEYNGKADTFKGDGSRGGPERRELNIDELSKL